MRTRPSRSAYQPRHINRDFVRNRLTISEKCRRSADLRLLESKILSAPRSPCVAACLGARSTLLAPALTKSTGIPFCNPQAKFHAAKDMLHAAISEKLAEWAMWQKKPRGAK